MYQQYLQSPGPDKLIRVLTGACKVFQMKQIMCEQYFQSPGTDKTLPRILRECNNQWVSITYI